MPALDRNIAPLDIASPPARKWPRYRNYIAFGILLTALGCCWGQHHPHDPGGGSRSGTADQIQFAFDQPLDKDGLPTPWQSRIIVGKPTAQVIDDSAKGKVMHICCDRAHLVLAYQAVPFDPQQFPILSWSWKALALPENADTRTHNQLPIVGDNRNDKALQVMVIFDGNYVLNYVWDSNAPVGYECDEWSPVATVKTRVIDSGPDHLNQWIEHRINVVDDYQRRYGKPPGPIIGVSVSANTNNTATHGEGLVATIAASTK